MAAVAPTPLDAAGRAALAAEFGKTFDGVRLLQGMQQAIVAHFAAKGESLTDVRSILVVSTSNPAGSERLWSELFTKDLNISSAADVEMCSAFSYG